MLGVNDDGLCVVTSNITAWMASCVIILGIWNDTPVFLVGAVTAGSSSIIIGWWGVCVVVGVWSASVVFSSSSASGEVSACMRFRRGECRLGHRFSICLIFCVFRSWEYHVSAAVCLVGCTPCEVGWTPYEVQCAPLGFFVIWFCGGSGISPGVLDRVSRWWLLNVSHSARGLVEFMEVWDWGSVPWRNFLAVPLVFCQCFYCLCLTSCIVFLSVL